MRLTAEIQVRHKRKQSPTVVADALADGACQLIVAPTPRARSGIWSDIRRVHLSGKALEYIHVLVRAVRFRKHGRIVRCPVVFCVASHAIDYITYQILATG